ncbi:MAG: C4-dicarboxylate ABC transporter substrate-binding protein [Burkholderiales bacterium]|nr:C4-dicarboxylate ABC transporter substrate-binding protein [Burkholderiales bacterium]
MALPVFSRESLGPVWLVAAAAAVLLALAYGALQPSPPRKVVLATGVDQGAYAEFGRRYAELLRRHGITVELRASQGAAENLALLRDANSGVDLAFVQGGGDERSAAEAQADSEGLVSLGSLFHEPVWLFYRQDSAQRLLKIPQLTRLNQLAGWKLNVGAPGSGVPPLMAQMLEANAVPAGAVQLSPLPLTPAVVELLEGRMDALVLASAPESPMVQMLLQTPGIALFDFVQAEAYARRFAFMSAVMLPRGVVNLSADQPPADVHLVAPTASLLAREGLHPALVQLFMQAATRVHGEAGWFQRKGEFPNAANTERPVADEAQRYFRTGPPWLQRYVPFWLANLVDRMWVMLLSLVVVALPLVRVLPPLYDRRIRSRVFRWYAQLREVEDARGRRPAAELQHELDEIDAKVGRVKVPLAYADELYALRSHIQLVRKRVAS